MTESIFHAVVTGENAYTRLLYNLMSRDMVFRRAIVARFQGVDVQQVADSGVEIIPQRRLPGACGQPDLRIESNELCVIVEVKTDLHRACTKKQEFTAGRNYLSYLQDQVRIGKRAVLVFLVPHNWKFRWELRNGITALKNMGDATSVRVVQLYWEDVLQILSDEHAKYETIFPEELRLLLTERFGPIKFGREELDCMFSSEFSIQTMVKLNAVLHGLRQKAGKRVASDLSGDKDESGFYLKKGKRSLLFIGSWVAFWDANHHYPLCFGVQDDESKIKDAFTTAFRKAYKSDAISFDGWSMGWIPEEDFMSVDAVDEIWARIEPIWNKVKDAAQ